MGLTSQIFGHHGRRKRGGRAGTGIATGQYHPSPTCEYCSLTTSVRPDTACRSRDSFATVFSIGYQAQQCFCPSMNDKHFWPNPRGVGGEGGGSARLAHSVFTVIFCRQRFRRLFVLALFCITRAGFWPGPLLCLWFFVVFLTRLTIGLPPVLWLCPAK